MTIQGRGVFLPPGAVSEFILDPEGSGFGGGALGPVAVWKECTTVRDTSGRVNVSQSGLESEAVAKTRMRAVRGMFEHAWEGYMRCARGRDEVRAESCEGMDWLHMGITIVDALDTMAVMRLAGPLQAII